jgi:hypothetical protein
MSWRNTDRAFGSRARGLRGIDGSVVGVSGLSGFVAPGTVPVMRWRNTDRAWGNRARGLPNTGPTGWGLRGLGQTDTTVIPTEETQMPPLDTSGGSFLTAPYNPPDAVAYTSPGGPVVPVPGSTVGTLTNLAQAGFTDAFNILKLLNPVPPGTVMQTTPYGTYISRAAAGQPTPTAAPFGTSAGGSMGLILLLGLGVAIFAFAGKGH